MTLFSRPSEILKGRTTVILMFFSRNVVNIKVLSSPYRCDTKVRNITDEMRSALSHWNSI